MYRVFECNISVFVSWSTCYVSVCDIITWRSEVGSCCFNFYILRMHDWHFLRFTALWLCLSSGAAEVMFWFKVLLPVFLNWPQDVVSILWPHPPPPPPPPPSPCAHIVPLLHHSMTAPLAAAHCRPSLSSHNVFQSHLLFFFNLYLLED